MEAEQVQPRRRSGRIRLILAAGLVTLGAVGAVTMAAYTDRANLNIGTDGIGFPDRFDIGVVMPDGTVEQATAPQGVDWVVSGAYDLLPGHAVTTSIPVFNNTPTLGADTTFAVVLRNTDGSVDAATPNITPYLRFTASVNGTVLFSDVPWDQAVGDLGVLTSRGDVALTQGDTYTAGTAGSEQTLVLTITYLDVPGVENFNGGQAALAVRFAATSVVL